MAFRISSFNINDMQGKNSQPYFNASNLRFVPITQSLGDGVLNIINNEVQSSNGININSLNVTTTTDSTLEFKDNTFELLVTDGIDENIIRSDLTQLSITADTKLVIGGNPTIIQGSGLRIDGGSLYGGAGNQTISKNHYIQGFIDTSPPVPYTLTLPDISANAEDNGITFLINNFGTQTITISRFDASQSIYQGGSAVSSITLAPNRTIQLIGLRLDPSNIRWIYQLFA